MWNTKAIATYSYRVIYYLHDFAFIYQCLICWCLFCDYTIFYWDTSDTVYVSFPVWWECSFYRGWRLWLSLWADCACLVHCSGEVEERQDRQSGGYRKYWFPVPCSSLGNVMHKLYIYKFLKDSVGPTTEMGQWPTSATSPKMWLRHSWHIDLIYTYTLHPCQHFAQVVEECQDGSCRAILDTGTSLSQPFQRRRCRYSCHLVKDWMVRMQTKKSLFKSMFRDSLSFHSFFQSLVSFKEVPQMQDPNSSCYIVFQRACVVNVPLIDSHRGWEFPDRQQGIMSWFYLILFG